MKIGVSVQGVPSPLLLPLSCLFNERGEESEKGVSVGDEGLREDPGDGG